MRTFDLAEKAMMFQYSLLSTHVDMVLEDAIAGKSLEPRDREILREGSDLLKRTIEGAALVEGAYGLHPTPSIEGLSIYGYALSTVEALGKVREIESFTQYFQQLLAKMQALIEEGKTVPDDLRVTQGFFRGLGDSFIKDIQGEAYLLEEQPLTPLELATL